MFAIKQLVTPVGFALASVLLMNCSTVDEHEIFKANVNEALHHHNRGMEFRLKKDFEGARAELLQSIAVSPRPRTYLALAELSLVQENLEDAEMYIDQSLRLAPQLTIARAMKQNLQNRRDARSVTAQPVNRNTVPEQRVRTVEPEKTIQTQPVQGTVIQPKPVDAVPAAPVRVEPGLQQARDAANQSNWEEALRLATGYIAENPNSAEGYYLAGYVNYQQENYEEAAQAFQQTIRLDGNHAKALNDLGITLEFLGRSAEAVAYYQRAVDTGQNPDAFFNLALLEEKRGQYAKAISLYERYLQQDETSAFAEFAKERIGKLRRVEY